MHHLVLAVSTALASAAAAAEFAPLPVDEDLAEWVVLGGDARFDVEDGVIIGTAADDGDNTFLATREQYGDFVLELEVRVDGRLNSGVQFRSHQDERVADGRVHGYQAEVDPSQRRWSGGVYEERRRGWLYPLTRNDECASAFKTGDWNAYRIEAVGPDIKTFVNGVPCARLIDPEGRRDGFIALQVHGVSNNGSLGAPGDTARFRNLRIATEDLEDELTEMPADVVEINYAANALSEWERARGFELLWDGKTTEGWRGARLAGFPEKGWAIEDGMLVVLSSGGGEARNGGDIVSLDEFSNFELSVDFKMTEGANSGIKYFVDPDLLRGEGSAIGLEFQILDDARHPDAKNGIAGNRTIGSLYDLISAGNLSESEREAKRTNPIGAWNRARIVVRGDRVEHWLNEIKVVEYDRGSQMFDALVKTSKYAKWPNFGRWESGPVLLQDHGDRVAFRSIKLRELAEPE